MKIKNISIILKEEMNKNDMTLSELSRISNISKSSIHDYLSGKTKPKQNNIYRLAKALNVSEAYLMGWVDENNTKISSTLSQITTEASKLIERRQKNVLNFTKDQLKEQNEDVIKEDIYYNFVPVYGYVSAGTGHYIEDTPIENIRVKGYVPRHDIALWVSGDSMEPVFRDKDIIYVNKTNHLYNGQIGVFILDGESYVKKIRIENDGIKLVSLNKKYEDIPIKEYSELHIVGRVIL